MYKVPDFFYIFMLVPEGFTKKPKHVACFGQYKILSENTVVMDGLIVY